MSERTALPVAYIHRIHSAATRAINNSDRRRDWPNGEWSSPVVTASLCSEIARLNIELVRMGEALRTAKNWMMCDNEFGDPEQLKADLQRIDTTLARVPA